MPQKFFTYKGFPLVRNKNEIYYGFMSDPFVINLKILTTKKIGDTEIADRVQLYQMSTDPVKITRTAKCDGGLYEALDMARVWLEKSMGEK
ncbi:MAG: hypothetical protein SPE43_04295 [Ruminococcus sp.]|nr:hypothetical protein [Oscillospiraceae bacterium]MDY4413574.1 hypothetical protein [Ruminococcus sp.]